MDMLFSTNAIPLEVVLNSLKKLRVSQLDSEYNLQEQIANCLKADSIPFRKEYKLGHRNRVDFLIDGGIAIESKRNKPNRNQVIMQIQRYAEFEEVKAVILVINTSMSGLPSEVCGKPCKVIGLQKQWGIAL